MFPWRGCLFHVLFVELGGAPVGLLIAWQVFAVGVNGSLGDALVLSVGGLLTLLALIAVHEIGHALAGWVVGLDIDRITVGPLQLVREVGRWRGRLNTAWSQLAAYVMPTIPEGGGRSGRWRRAVMIFGGPLSNLLVGTACLFAASHLNPGPPLSVPAEARTGWRNVALLYPGDLATAWLNVAGIVSLALGLFNLLPGYGAGQRNDGGLLLDLWRGKY